MAFWSNWLRQNKVVTEVITGKNGTATWPERDYHNFAKEAYLMNIYAYRCVNEIAQSVSSVPWRLFKGDPRGDKKEVTDHQMVDLFNQSNPSEGVNAFINRVTAFLVLDGDSYVERIGPITGENAGQARELYSIRPDRIKLIKDSDTGAIIGYELNEGGVTKKIWPIDPITMQADLLHLKLFHPINDYLGAAPTETAAREIDTSNEATTWNKKLLENEARPGMLFKFKQTLGDQQYKRFKKQLEEGYSGASKAGQNLILEGDADAVPYGWNMQEMDFIDSGREIGRRVATAYGVPSQIIGILGDSTFANFEQAELSFWEKTVMFYLRYLKAEFNNWLFKNDGVEKLFLDFDLDEIPALEPRRAEKYALAQKSDFLTINEKRRLVGQEDHDDGDVILIPANMIPLGEDKPMDEEDMDDEEVEVVEELVAAGFDEDDLGLHLKAVK